MYVGALAGQDGMRKGGMSRAAYVIERFLDRPGPTIRDHFRVRVVFFSTPEIVCVKMFQVSWRLYLCFGPALFKLPDLRCTEEESRSNLCRFCRLPRGLTLWMLDRFGKGLATEHCHVQI